MDLLLSMSVWIIPILIALCFHEAAHGWAAWKLGDPTAKMLGRVTLNPIRHIHPVGTILLPLFLLYVSNGTMTFGFAKPVPIDPRNFANPRRDSAIVAAAGPLSNLLIAALATRLLAHFGEEIGNIAGEGVLETLIFLAWINVFLFVLNMLPVPPLDGGRVVVGILPLTLARRYARIEEFGIFLIILALFILPMAGDAFGIDLNVGRLILFEPSVAIMEFLLF